VKNDDTRSNPSCMRLAMGWKREGKKTGGGRYLYGKILHRWGLVKKNREGGGVVKKIVNGKGDFPRRNMNHYSALGKN